MITASAAGVSSAPATPRTLRAAMSAIAVEAMAQATDASPKPSTRARRIRPHPKTSPTEPPTSKIARSVSA